MEKQTIKFIATNGQRLERITPLRDFATGTVNYILAEFELSEIWNGYDNLYAMWFTDKAKKETPIDDTRIVTIPREVLENKGAVRVNLCASITEGGKVIKRVTTYPVTALTLTQTALDD